MRFLLDMNLPPAMADWLRAEGHDAVHLRELGGEMIRRNLPARQTGRALMKIKSAGQSEVSRVANSLGTGPI